MFIYFLLLVQCVSNCIKNSVEIGDHSRNWKHSPYTQIGKMNTVILSILTKEIYRSDANPIKTPAAFFTETEVLTFSQNCKRP